MTQEAVDLASAAALAPPPHIAGRTQRGGARGCGALHSRAGVGRAEGEKLGLEGVALLVASGSRPAPVQQRKKRRWECSNRRGRPAGPLGPGAVRCGRMQVSKRVRLRRDVWHLAGKRAGACGRRSERERARARAGRASEAKGQMLASPKRRQQGKNGRRLRREEKQREFNPLQNR